MKRITLVCNLGLSTSMVVKKMQEEAKNTGIAVSIEAVPESELKKISDTTDIVLLGPQISYKLNTLRSEYEGLKIEAINGTDYAIMNGKKILDFALDKINNK